MNIEQNGSDASNTVILRRRLVGHQRRIFRLMWSDDGFRIFSSGEDKTVREWDVRKGGETRRPISSSSFRVLDWTRDGEYLAIVPPTHDGDVRVRNLKDGNIVWDQNLHKGTINALAWSPNARYLATGSVDYTAVVWDRGSQKAYRNYDHPAEVTVLSWSPDGKFLATGTGRGRDNRIRIFGIMDNLQWVMPKGHTAGISCLVWHPGGRYLASGSNDRTIRIWDLRTRQEICTLEGHTDAITSLSFSHDGLLLASKSQDETVGLWSSVKDWELVKILRGNGADYAPCDLVFHASRSLLATTYTPNVDDRQMTAIDIYEIRKGIHDEKPDVHLVYYRNAKVVLVGEGKAGKTTLGHALMGLPTDNVASTHGVNVWPFSSDATLHKRGWGVKREIFLWDLSGQEQYRLIHQLYLKEVALALLVFDGSSHNDPLRSIRYWGQALNRIPAITQSAAMRDKAFIFQALAHDPSLPDQGQEYPIKFLVQTHADHGKMELQELIDEFLKDQRIRQYFHTSIRNNNITGVNELREAIKAAIPWEQLPEVVSNEFFEMIRGFLQDLQKNSGLVVAPIHQLYEKFCETGLKPDMQFVHDLRQQFETCIEFLEGSHFMRRFKFNRLVLLKPEILDFYASAIINAARSDKIDGFGRLRESTIWNAEFPIPPDERLKGLEEQWLLLATIDDLVTHEIALRERDNLLIFPSQVIEGNTREHINFQVAPSIRYNFRGSIQHIYSALVIRLARSQAFRLDRSARYVARFVNDQGAIFGLRLVMGSSDLEADMELFFSEDATQLERYKFDFFIDGELKKAAEENSVIRVPIFTCANCGYQLPSDLTQQRLETGRDNMFCPSCDHRIRLIEPPITKQMEQELQASRSTMVRTLDQVGRRESAKTLLSGKKAINNYDVIILHNRDNPVDVQSVHILNQHLEARGIYVWYDDPITPQMAADYLREKAGAVAALIGAEGLKNFHHTELEALITYCRSIGKPFIFILPPYFGNIPQDILQLRDGVYNAYFFRNLDETSALDDLEKWITGIDPR